MGIFGPDREAKRIADNVTRLLAEQDARRERKERKEREEQAKRERQACPRCKSDKKTLRGGGGR